MIRGSGPLPAVGDDGPHTRIWLYNVRCGDAGRLLHPLVRCIRISVTAVHARAAPCNDEHHCRGPDVLDCGKISELRQDGAAAALPAGDGDLESSLGRH